jgi:alpha-mannosidase
MSGSGGATVTLSNADLAFMKLGRSEVVKGVSRLDTATPNLAVLAGGQVDGEKLGIPAQGGDSRLLHRFGLQTSAESDRSGSMRFALEHQNPLRTGFVSGGGTEYPEKSFSLLRLEGEDVFVWAVKPAEEGVQSGVIARIWNVGSGERAVRLTLNGGISRASAATHIETDLAAREVKDGAVVDTLRPSQLVTYRLVPAAP